MSALVILIILPSAIQAVVWTSVNLILAVSVVAAFIIYSLWVPYWKWIVITLAALIMSIPPYPNWIWASNEKGWHFHVGYKLSHFDEYAVGYLVFFVVEFFLFLGLSSVVRKLNGKPKKGTP